MNQSFANGKPFRLCLFFVVGGVAMSLQLASAQSYCGPTTVANFNGLNGQYPAAGVTFDSNGAMYGTTSQGGPLYNPNGPNGILNNGLGTIWKYSPSAGFTTLFAFSGVTSPTNNGYRPEATLTIDASGNLYGSTAFGGNGFAPNSSSLGLGTLFKLSSTGQFTELYKFNGPDGSTPTGALILDNQGSLWGTTWDGGFGYNINFDQGLGTVFEYDDLLRRNVDQH